MSGDLTSLFPVPSKRTTAVEATIASAPPDPNGDLYVTVESFDGKRQRWGPVRWIPGSVIPNRGDTCLLVFDETEQPWAILTDQILANVGMDADATTLAAGSQATAVVDEVDPNQFVLHLGIPQGEPGVSPVGSIVMFGGAAAPTNWLLCDGASYAQTAYPALYAAIGAAYGGGGGSFNVPDLRKRVPVGAGSGLGLGASDGLAEASRNPKHHHRLTAGVAVSVAAVGDHQHSGVGDHTHGGAGGHAHGNAGSHVHTVPGGDFAVSVGNTGQRGTAGTTFTLTSSIQSFTDQNGDHAHPGVGDHQHPAAGGHTHGAAGGHGHTGSGSVDADTSGGGPADGPSYAVLNYIIRAL